MANEEEYVRRLREHDWTYDYSDDQSVWRKGSDERKRLNQLAKDLDPDFKIWNIHCPTDYQDGRK